MNEPHHLYRTSPVKRIRRTNEQLDAVLESVRAVIAEYHEPITIRHLYYRLVGLRVIEKTEADYKKLCTMLAKWRRSHAIAYSDFVDGTRWSSGPDLWDSAAEALQNTANCYRRNLWAEQGHYVEVWVEKDAIKSIVMEAAYQWGVRVFAARGFPSMSSLATAAETFLAWQAHGKKVHILYLGDHDPSGLAIDTNVKNALLEDHGVDDVDFRRLAVTPGQIAQYNLPTRPVKTSDRRSRDWNGGCVEIDTLPPATIKELISDAITSFIEPHAWDQLKQAEKLERESMMAYCAAMKGAA